MNALIKCWILVAGLSVVLGALSCSRHDSWPENTAERCADGIDNDQDGLADCSDPDCTHSVPDICSSAGEICNDGIDNDGDGNTDCYDSDCGFEGAFEVSCDDGVDNDCDGNTDAWDTDCWSSGSENCGDGLDNDGDGNSDCWDTDCGFEGAIELTCSDYLDNDCDGNTDCWDPDCAAACETTCTPTCAGKVCGPDGCGDYCGFCGVNESCNIHGQCVETYVCMESTASGCSDCPEGWQDCLTENDEEGNPVRSFCSKRCTTDAECGDCGACYEIEPGSYCLNYDAYAVESYCPVDWRCSPDYSHCTDLGVWNAEGLSTYLYDFEESEAYVDRLVVDIPSHPGMLVSVDTYDFRDGTAMTGTFNLRYKYEGNYASCYHCIRLLTGCTESACQKVFFQAMGTGTYYDVNDQVGENYSGIVSEIALVEVTIDTDNYYWSSPVPGGECYRMRSFTWGNPLQDPDGGGTSSGSESHASLAPSGGTASGGG